MVSGWEDCCGLGTSPLLFGVEYMGERNIGMMWMCRASYGQDQIVNLDVCSFTNLNFSQFFSLVLLVHAFCVLGLLPVSSGIISNWWTHHWLKSGWGDYLLVCLFCYLLLNWPSSESDDRVVVHRWSLFTCFCISSPIYMLSFCL